MTTLLVILVVILVAGLAATIVLRLRWDLDSFAAVWPEVLARNLLRPRSAKAFRTAFVEAICAQHHTSLTGEASAWSAMTVRIAPEDALRLNPSADVAIISREATEVYLQHAQSSGWRIDGLPAVRVVTDGRLRPGWVPKPTPGAPTSGQTIQPPAPSFQPVLRPTGGQDREQDRAQGPDEQQTRIVPLVQPGPEATQQIEAVPSVPDLVVEYGGQRYEIVGRVLGIGRKHNDHFALSEPTASYRHVLLERRDSGWTVRDLKSTNGSLLNGRRLGEEPEPLMDGAELRLGGADVVVHLPQVPFSGHH